MQYDDGTAWWVTWTGHYRGVWFNSADFYGTQSAIYLHSSKLWFYHHEDYPWDTSSFYCEVYNGGVSGPETELAETSVMAQHYTLCSVEYGINCEAEMWIFVNTEMSSGNWPSILGDNTPNWTGHSHSFYSEDIIVWEPWIIQGPVANDYLISTDDWVGLSQTTWGGIKRMFR
ncbi:hypothetical protein GF402_10450 [Candidatus Fermentibacteria bacterium]|nr:hypothetical protein [Candidatus Fermentibacteria bacterium]